jgi:DNA-binding transcriptional MerR regulator
MKNKLQLIRQIIKEETSKFIKKKKLLEEKSTLIKKLKRLDENYEEDFIDKVSRRFREELPRFDPNDGSYRSYSRDEEDAVSDKLAQEFGVSYDEIVDALQSDDERGAESDYEEEYDDRDDDYDSGMSSSQQAHADRSDYAREKMEKGDWDEEQAAEFRAGA